MAGGLAVPGRASVASPHTYYATDSLFPAPLSCQSTAGRHRMPGLQRDAAAAARNRPEQPASSSESSSEPCGSRARHAPRSAAETAAGRQQLCGNAAGHRLSEGHNASAKPHHPADADAARRGACSGAAELMHRCACETTVCLTDTGMHVRTCPCIHVGWRGGNVGKGHWRSDAAR